MAKKGLGKGISALFQDSNVTTVERNSAVQEIAVDVLEPGAFQPRALFDERLLQELADSIKENGVLQPIVIRPARNKETFEIIAGERRWRAAKSIGLERIPAVIRDVEDKVALELGLIENIQRKSLTPIEEAEGYKKLLREFHYTQETLAQKVGKSRSHISNLLRLLELPDEVKHLVNTEKLSMGHARTLVGKADAAERAHQIIDNNLSVRDAEEFTPNDPQSSEKLQKTGGKARAGKDEDLIALENALSGKLGLPVLIKDKRGKGAVSIQFTSLTELDKIIQRLSAA